MVSPDEIAVLILIGISTGIGFIGGLIVYKMMKNWIYSIIAGIVSGGVLVFIVLFYTCPGPFCNIKPTRNYVTGFSYFNINDFSFFGEELSISLKSKLNESLIIESINFIGVSGCYGSKTINESISYQELKKFNITGNENCKNTYFRGDVFKLDFIIRYINSNKIFNTDFGNLNGIVS